MGISRAFDILTKEINQRECNVMTQAATLERDVSRKRRLLLAG